MGCCPGRVVLDGVNLIATGISPLLIDRLHIDGRFGEAWWIALVAEAIESCFQLLFKMAGVAFRAYMIFAPKNELGDLAQ